MMATLAGEQRQGQRLPEVTKKQHPELLRLESCSTERGKLVKKRPAIGPCWEWKRACSGGLIGQEFSTTSEPFCCHPFLLKLVNGSKSGRSPLARSPHSGLSKPHGPRLYVCHQMRLYVCHQMRLYVCHQMRLYVCHQMRLRIRNGARFARIPLLASLARFSTV